MNHALLIASLRWTLFKNSLRRKSNMFELIMGAIAFVVFSLFDMGLSVGLAALTYAAYRRDFFAPMLTIALGGILVIWQLIPVFTASFSGDLNVSKFRIYPLTTRSLFLIDLLLGVFDPVAVLAIILIAGVFVGAVAASPHSAPIAAIGLLLFIAFNIALARYVQRLLAGLFASRRSKEVLALLLFLVLLVPQVLIMTQQHQPNRRSRGRSPEEVEFAKQRLRDMQSVGRAIKWTPPGVAAAALNPEPLDPETELLVILAGFLFAAAVFGLEYKRLTRDHLGIESSGKKTKRSARQRKPRLHSKSSSAQLDAGRTVATGFSGLIERMLSPVSAAVFEKDLRYIYRSPRALMIAIAPIAASIIFLLPGTPFTRSSFAGQYRLAGVLLYALIVSSQLLNNCFAFDWHGAKLYFMSPAHGRSILIGKNLAASVAITLQVLIIGLAFSLLSGPLSFVGILNALFVFAIVLPINLTVGNYLSVMYPRGIDFSKVYGRSYSGVSAAVGLAVLPALVILLGSGPLIGWLLESGVAVFCIFALELVLALSWYFLALRSAGRLLENRAEQFLQGLLTTR